MYSVILGHLGSDAVAANSIANIAKNLLICGCVGFGYGGSIIVGNLLGEGSLSEAGKYGNTLCKIAVFLGALTGGDTRFGLKCDAITMWCFAVPLGYIAAFVLKLPVLMVYFVLNLDELVKLPAVFKHYRQYKWLKNLTETEN